MVALLSDIFAIEIDWMITAPHHGKGLHDALAGLDKHYLANAMIRGMDSAQCDEHFKSISEAEKCCDKLNDPSRGENDSKHGNKRGLKPTDKARKLNDRKYSLSNYDGEPIPAKDCGWKIMDSQWKKAFKDHAPDENGVHRTTYWGKARSA